jgi:diacylglycerol kinase family enzyme
LILKAWQAPCTTHHVAVTASSCVVLLNQSSGLTRREGIDEKVAALLGDGGGRYTVQLCERGVDLSEVAKDAVRSGAETVVAGGGDGTLRAVASALVNTGAAFGILPLGKLNHFARDLEIPLDLEGAVRTVTAGHTRAVDAAEVNGRVFLNNAIIGFYPTYRFQREYLERKGYGRWAAFFWAVMSVFRRHPFFSIRCLVDGKLVTRTTPFVMVANNEHQMTGYRLGSRERMDAGELWIYLMRRRGRWGLIRMALSLLLGRFRRERDFDVYRAREVWIEPRQKKVGVSLDGEVAVMGTPLHFRSLAGALKVIAPGGRAEDGRAEVVQAKTWRAGGLPYMDR